MIERDLADGILTLRLAHGKASAMDVELLAAFCDELDAAAEARAVVLTGTGSIFSAGVDLFRLTDEGEAYVRRFFPLLTDLIRRLTDKALFQALAERIGLPVPPARWLVPSVTGPPADLPFPLVVKPVPRRDGRWRALADDAKAMRVGTIAELEELWPRFAAGDIAVLAQQEVPGPETEILSYHVYVDPDGQVAGEFTGRKIRTYPLELGMSTALVTTADERVARLGRDFVGRIGLRGPAKLDFKRGPDGELRLLEVNPRFTLWVHAGAVAGVNLPALMHADLTGAARPPRAAGRPGVRWVSLRGDRDAARASGIGKSRWLAWALRCETNSAFAWGDPGPLLGRLPGARGRAGHA